MATSSRLKINPPLGNLPALQWALVSQLQVDAEYQRSTDNGPSQNLIRKIAMHWNWDLCQPLVVSRRADGSLFVIDGQHRWEAAVRRGDITQLPCVVVDYASAADEAASFVHLNQQRKPLSKLDVFKAAVASEDEEACAILAAMEAAGLSVAPHGNFTAWKPGMVSNIGGIEAAWRKHGAEATGTAMAVLSKGLAGQVLQYAGTIFPGLVSVCADDEIEAGSPECVMLEDLLGSRAQVDWRSAILQAKAANPNLKYAAAATQVLGAAWSDWLEERGQSRPGAVEMEQQPEAPAAPTLVNFNPDDSGMGWCDQCDMRVSRAQAEGCKSRHCSLHPKVAEAA